MGWRLPKDLSFEVLTYVPVGEVVETVRRVSKAFKEMGEEYAGESRWLKGKCFGVAEVRMDRDPDLYLRLLFLSSRPPLLLHLLATYTNGGMIGDDPKYWLQNMFDYTGSVYTTNQLSSNVTTRAVFSGLAVKTAFNKCMHEDLYCWEHLRNMIPGMYQGVFVPSEVFMTGKGQRRAMEYSGEELRGWVWEEEEIDPQLEVMRTAAETYEVSVPEPQRLALITHIGIGRPGFFTCPVHTLLIFTKLTPDPLDLTPFYDLTTFASLTRSKSLQNPVCYYVDESYEYAEFDSANGPAVWVQFREKECAQVEIKLKYPRFFLYTEVLLLDIDDRRADYGVTDLGIDVSFVVFAGIPLPFSVLSLIDIENRGENTAD